MHVDISPQLRGFERTRSAASTSDERNSEDIKRAQKTEATSINLRMSLATFLGNGLCKRARDAKMCEVVSG